MLYVDVLMYNHDLLPSRKNTYQFLYRIKMAVIGMIEVLKGSVFIVWLSCDGEKCVLLLST